MGAGAVTGHNGTHSNSVLPTPVFFTSSIETSGGKPGSIPSTSHQSNTEPKQKTFMPREKSKMSDKVITCETCDNNFSFFKRKKLCKDCHRYFCSTCLPKPPSNLRQNGRQCIKCNILSSGKFTRQQLQSWKIKDIRCFLDVQKIPTSSCTEKHDLIELVIIHFCPSTQSSLAQQMEHERLVEQLTARMRNSSLYVTSDHVTSVLSNPSEIELQESPVRDHNDDPEQVEDDSLDSSQDGDEGSNIELNNFESLLSMHAERLRERQEREMQEALERLREELAQEEAESRPGIRRATIEDVLLEDDAEKLSVRQLKEILVNNFVDYRGCCEKSELVERVKRLWREEQTNKQRAAAANAPKLAEEGNVANLSGEQATDTPSSVSAHVNSEQDICKICMDAAIDCILLECGHMVTCTKCGKRLADCPICRQFIARVVHVFRT